MKIICITSPKGGCGASFCAANLANVLSQMGSKCLLADLGFRNASLDVILGLTDGFVFNLSDVLKSRCKFDDAIVREVNGKNIDFASTSTLETANEANCTKILTLLKDSGSAYDYIIADVPINSLNEQISEYIDTTLYVTDSQRASVAILERYVHSLDISCSKYVIVNRVVPELISDGGGVNIDDICDITGLTPIGIIPFDVEIEAYNNIGILSTTNDDLLSTREFKNIAERINGNHVCAVDFKYKTPYYKKIKNIIYRR